MHRKIKALTLSAGIALTVCFSLVGYFVYTRYWVYHHCVDTLIADLPSEEKALPPNAREVLLRVDKRQIRAWVAFKLIVECQPTQTSSLDWQAREALWQVLLPSRLSAEQMLGLYGHFMTFEGGSGLAYGAKYYFGKSLADLTRDEMLGLLAISRSPHMFSPKSNPEKYRKEVERLRKELQIG